MKEYRLIKTNIQWLTDRLDRLAKNGWVCQGGVGITGNTCVQLVVREVEGTVKHGEDLPQSAAELVVCPEPCTTDQEKCKHCVPHVRIATCDEGCDDPVCPSCVPVSEVENYHTAVPTESVADETRYEIRICRQGKDSMKLYGSYLASQIAEGLEWWFANESEDVVIEVKRVAKSAADIAKPQ